jgi:hypothetical protein
MSLVGGRQGGEKGLSRGDFKAGKLEFLDMIDAQEHAWSSKEIYDWH